MEQNKNQYSIFSKTFFLKKCSGEQFVATNCLSHIPNSSCTRGSFLLELLIVIALLGVILGVGAQAVFVSLQSGKIAGERDVAIGLASESLEAVRGFTEESWENIYALTKGSQYQTVKSGNKWATSIASETIALNNVTYTRYFVVENVSRDSTVDRKIEPTYNSANDDPSTQKVTVTVSWTGADIITISEYFFRWKNMTCAQTDWAGGATSPTDNTVPAANCTSSTVYFTSDNTMATSTAGKLELK